MQFGAIVNAPLELEIGAFQLLDHSTIL